MAVKLVLLRHGQSTWNLENRFTGWTDVGLSELGVQEARAAGRMLLDEGLTFDEVHSSLLKRAILSSNLALEEMDLLWLPDYKSWRLNERHYGALQGLNKKETAQIHGDDQVFIWRRSYDVPPPPLDAADPRHPGNDPRYADLPSACVPAAECLKDVVERFLPYWHETIVPRLKAGKRLLISAHGNSLRALVKHLDQVADEEIPRLNIPTGIPLLYELDDELKPISSRYLGDPEAAKKAAQAVADQAR